MISLFIVVIIKKKKRVFYENIVIERRDKETQIIKFISSSLERRINN